MFEKQGLSGNFGLEELVHVEEMLKQVDARELEQFYADHQVFDEDEGEDDEEGEFEQTSDFEEEEEDSNDT